ncbi:MAG: hypothetical protein L0Z55_09290 [Planctomycetes bacterium]|nr:hypothetical protein [Planctomycetota bacterium]
MFMLRKVGAILRGKSTPFQLFTACLLGGLMGFAPLPEGLGLFLLYIFVLVILNANLGVSALVLAFSKLLSLVLLPASFHVGRVLLDGPTQGLFKALINAPVFALLGLEHYVVSGGIVLGALEGAAAGKLLVKAVTAFRRKFAQLEENSERYQKLFAKGWVRGLAWVVVGPKAGSVTYAQLLERKVGNPVRVLGIAFVAVSAGFLYLLQVFFSEPLLTAMLRSGLERANGATVELESASLDLAGGRLVVAGLHMADRENLDEDLVRATRLEADISSRDLLRKRICFDRIVVTGAEHGEKRAVPGRRIRAEREPREVERLPDEKTLEEYLADAEKWRRRLAQVADWIELLGERKPEEAEAPGSESLADRLRRRAEASGYARVVATHLIEGAPTVTVTELVADAMRSAQRPGDLLQVRCENLSSQPWLLEAAPRVQIQSQSKAFRFDFRFGGIAAGGSASTVDLALSGLSIDEVAKGLRAGGERLLEGGTMDLAVNGGIFAHERRLDLPLQVVLHDTKINVPGRGSAPVSKFGLGIALRGPIDDPGIRVDPEALADALVGAGIDAAKEKAKDALQKELEKAASKELGEPVKGILGDILGGKKEEATEKPKEEKKRP